MNRVMCCGAGRAAMLAVTALIAAGGLAYWRFSPAMGTRSSNYAVASPAVSQKDNSACLVCHLDFENEELAVVHLKADIVCASCHGDSEVHRSDELNVTPPEILYGGSEIQLFCKTCHPGHRDPEKYAKFLNEWNGRRRPNARLITADSLCTDCHGNHVILDSSKQNGG